MLRSMASFPSSLICFGSVFLSAFRRDVWRYVGFVVFLSLRVFANDTVIAVLLWGLTKSSCWYIFCFIFSVRLDNVFFGRNAISVGCLAEFAPRSACSSSMSCLEHTVECSSSVSCGCWYTSRRVWQDLAVDTLTPLVECIETDSTQDYMLIVYWALDSSTH